MFMVETGRRASDNLTLPMIPASSPWWVQVGLILLFWLGPAFLVGVWSISMWSGWIPSPITENQKILIRLESKVDVATNRMTSEVENSRRNDEQVVRLLLATCRNVAKNDVDKTQCDNYWRR